MAMVEIIPLDNYMLHIKTDDEQMGLFDVKPYLESEVFKPLHDKNEFMRIHNGGYFLEWDCGADLSLDTICKRWTLN
jgi:hypothetical protein